MRWSMRSASSLGPLGAAEGRHRLARHLGEVHLAARREHQAPAAVAARRSVSSRACSTSTLRRWAAGRRQQARLRQALARPGHLAQCGDQVQVRLAWRDRARPSRPCSCRLGNPVGDVDHLAPVVVAASAPGRSVPARGPGPRHRSSATCRGERHAAAAPDGWRRDSRRRRRRSPARPMRSGPGSRASASARLPATNSARAASSTSRACSLGAVIASVYVGPLVAASQQHLQLRVPAARYGCRSAPARAPPVPRAGPVLLSISSMVRARRLAIGQLRLLRHLHAAAEAPPSAAPAA